MSNLSDGGYLQRRVSNIDRQKELLNLSRSTFSLKLPSELQFRPSSPIVVESPLLKIQDLGWNKQRNTSEIGTEEETK